MEKGELSKLTEGRTFIIECGRVYNEDMPTPKKLSVDPRYKCARRPARWPKVPVGGASWRSILLGPRRHASEFGATCTAA